MSFMSKVKAGGRELARGNNLTAHQPAGGLHGRGFTGFVVDKGERAAASLLFGYGKGYYREKFVYKGFGYDLWAGAAATVLGAIFSAASNGNSVAALHLERVGDAGVGSYLNSIGAAMGAKKAGRVVQVLSGGKALPGLGARTGVLGNDVVGMIPAAMGGTYLSADEIAKYASKR